MKEESCLEYLLRLLSQGEDFVILYNENHCVGVNENQIFEKGSAFKRDLMHGYSLKGANTYLPLHEFYKLDHLVHIFALGTFHAKTLKNYLNKHKQ